MERFKLVCIKCTPQGASPEKFEATFNVVDVKSGKVVNRITRYGFSIEAVEDLKNAPCDRNGNVRFDR